MFLFSRVIPVLTEQLKSGFSASSRPGVAGVCHALRVLADEFPTSLYAVAWSLAVPYCPGKFVQLSAVVPFFTIPNW